MPINPNIALGGQPVQQPNILGQMGQMMAIRAAQQEIEGSEGVKNYFAKPESERDPTALLGSRQGRESLRALNESKKQQTDLLLKNLGITASAFGVIEKNPTVETAQSVFGDLVRMEVMPEKVAQASIAKVLANPTPENIRSLARQGIDYGISAADKLTAQTRLQAANIGAGPGHRQANLAEQKFEFEKTNPGFEYKTLDNGGIAAVNKRTNAVTLLQAPGAAPTTPPINALTPTPAANLNALVNPPVVNQPGAPTIANAAALPTTSLRAAPRPGYEYNAQGQQVPITDPNKVVNTVTDKFGTVSMLNAAGDVIRKVEGMGKPSAGVEAQQQKEIVSKEGKESVNRVLSNLYSEYGNLVKSGGITDTRQSVEENISARTGASAVGQLTGSFTGSEAQSFRDSIEQTRPLLLTAIMKATGLSATQLNSNVELQTYLKTATDPKVSIQSNVKALNNISTMFGLGEKFDVPEIPKATSKAAKPADAVPSGLPPDIAALWPYISSEDRKLWQK